MAVYFARKISDPTHIKIGTANNIPTRVTAVASAVGPLHLFATMPGGIALERNIQARFSDLRIEGEWFRSSPELETYIRISADHEDRDFGIKDQAWKPKAVQPLARREHDARAALKLLHLMFERYPRQTAVARCLELAYEELHGLNEGWSRRRVRAIHELRGLRTDLFEIVDMLTLLEIPRHQWADWIAPVSQQEREAA
jgi:hypothetical protein